ncbi:MAG TPA: hypothetical protein VM889_13675 [Candidatus Thermoplasmatota archaeon]|nr:hypothetical protein [Candidatus Thermoplasmatota archaeon]
MKRAFLEDADGPAVVDAVRARLAARGALVTEHTRARVRFEGLAPAGETFHRSGYVGVYQPFAEQEAELRVLAYAARPRRAFWTTTLLVFLAGVLMLALMPDTDTWVLVTVLAYVAFVATLLVYLGTWRATSALEVDLLDDLAAAAVGAGAAKRVLTPGEREEAAFETQLEADVLEVRLKKAAKADAKRGVRTIPVKIPRRAKTSEPVPAPAESGAPAPEPAPPAKRSLLDRFRRAPREARASQDEARPKRGLLARFARAPRAERAPRVGFVARLKDRFARRGTREVPVEDEAAKRARLDALKQEIEARRGRT